MQTPQRPLRVLVPSRVHLAQMATWLNDPAVAGPLDLMPPFSADALSTGMVRCLRRDACVGLAAFRAYLVVDSADLAVGFGLTYGWETPDDAIRELDMALPAILGSHTTLVLEALTHLVDWCFRVEGAIEVRGRVRTGVAGRGFGRFYGAVGAKEVARPVSVVSSSYPTGERILYSGLPDDFYRSRAARRYLCPPALMAGSSPAGCAPG